MKSIVLPAGTEHVQFGELAHRIADALWPAAGPDDDRMTYACSRINFDGELARAVDSGALPVKDPLTLGPHTYPVGYALKTALVTVDDLQRFVSDRGLSVIVETPEPQTLPVPLAGASDGVEPAKAGPRPLTTGDIAFCFAGLHWRTETEWKKPLGDKPKWLAACIVIPGVQGVSETRWSPVCIGAALVRDGHAKANSVRAKFQTMPLLTPWLDEWKTYEADNFDSN